MFEQRSVFSTEADIKTFFFNGTTVENIPHQWRAAGVIPSPDGSYFVSESCEGSVNSGGSAYVIYETSTGHMQGQILTGTAPFNGCDEDRQIGYRSSYVFPLANGTDWVLSSVRALPTYLVLRICRKDGRCVPQKWGWSPLMSVLPYTSVHFQASSFGNAVTIYEAASHQLTTYLISHMKVLDTVWSPATS